MATIDGLSFSLMCERLGQPTGRGFSAVPGHADRHHFRLLWPCSGRTLPGDACVATAQALDTPMPPGLDAAEQEFFDTAPIPELDWSLRPCERHRPLFADLSDDS